MLALAKHRKTKTLDVGLHVEASTTGKTTYVQHQPTTTTYDKRINKII